MRAMRGPPSPLPERLVTVQAAIAAEAAPLVTITRW